MMYETSVMSSVVEDEQTSDIDSEEEAEEIEQRTAASDTDTISSKTLSCARGNNGTKYFGFIAKTSYDATEALLKSRSDNFLLKRREKDNDIWKRPPPDFRPQEYAPKPPKRNTRDSMQPWKYGTIPGEKENVKKERKSRFPSILNKPAQKEDCFVTRFPDILGSYEARLQAVKHGKYRQGPYEMPKLHDFRGYPPIKSLGLPEFTTDYERDPYNNNFNSEHLDVIHGLNSRPLSGSQHHGKQMAPPKTPQPQWEARLILDKEDWPLKSAAYTRYRRTGRNPHSALMERIEDRLTTEWEMEKRARTGPIPARQ